jgi:hypothetical protein
MTGEPVYTVSEISLAPSDIEARQTLPVLYGISSFLLLPPIECGLFQKYSRFPVTASAYWSIGSPRRGDKPTGISLSEGAPLLLDALGTPTIFGPDSSRNQINQVENA